MEGGKKCDFFLQQQQQKKMLNVKKHKVFWSRDLTGRDLEILKVLWSRGPGTKEVQKSRDLKMGKVLGKMPTLVRSPLNPRGTFFAD